MVIEKIHIKNFKSLVDVTIENPNPFTVFVGTNASGKSNIFEAIEFLNYSFKTRKDDLLSLFNGRESIVNYNLVFSNNLGDLILVDKYDFLINIKFSKDRAFFATNDNFKFSKHQPLPLQDYEKLNAETQFFNGFTRLFINNPRIEKMSLKDDKRLASDAKNLEKVLKRILQIKSINEEFIEWLIFLVPDFDNLEISSDELSGSDNLLIYEKHTNKPFPRHLISDGTFNIITLLTSVFQSDEPQFLCIEEPENGIHPEAIKELVSFFREQCEEKGHYIWLTTHSQSLVSELKPEEIIVVDKIKGETKIKQFQGEEFYSLKMDDAWLSNVLGGGLI